MPRPDIYRNWSEPLPNATTPACHCGYCSDHGIPWDCSPEERYPDAAPAPVVYMHYRCLSCGWKLSPQPSGYCDDCVATLNNDGPPVWP